MKKSFLFFLVSIMLTFIPVAHAQLFNPLKTYVIKTVVPVAYSGNKGNFVAGDTVYWASNPGNLYGSKADGIYPVIKSSFDNTKLQFLWVIEPTLNTANGIYSYKIKNLNSPSGSGYFNYWSNNAHDVYLGNLVNDWCATFTITATTDLNGKVCFNVSAPTGSGDAYLSNVIDVSKNIGAMNSTAGLTAPYPSIYIRELSVLSPVATASDKAGLSAAIQLAKTKYNSRIEGSLTGQYSAANSINFNASITNAETIYTNITSTVFEVTNALNTLKSATVAFKNSITVSKNSIVDGLYYISISEGTTDYYLTDIYPHLMPVNGTSTPTAFAPKITSGDSLNFQQFKLTLDGARYRIDGKYRSDNLSTYKQTYLNENCAFGGNDYGAVWNTMNISFDGIHYAIQREGGSGSGYWYPSSYASGASVNSQTTNGVNISDNLVFKFIPVPASETNNTLTSFTPLNNKLLKSGSGISWVSPLPGTFNVYIGESQDSINIAGVTSKFYKGNVSTSYFDMSSMILTSGSRYYWRIDVVNEGVVKKGGVNAFIIPINSSVYHSLRNGLRNSFLQFENQKTARVAFLGGSITYNHGWRDSISAYLTKRFPTIIFDFIAAGIPSEGSTPDAFRIVKDVLSKGKVDLLFVEAAVNDGPDGNNFPKIEQIRAMEGIARHAYTANPMMDVVFMYFVDPGKINSYNNGIVPDVIVNHDLVAQTYSIPSINLAKEVTERIKLGEFNWASDFQDLHPSAFGQGVYAHSMLCFLDSAWKNPVLPNEQMSPKSLPSKMDPYCYDSGCLVNINQAEASANWFLNPNWTPTDGTGTREDYTNVPMLIGQTPGAILTFNFNGKAVGISTASGPDAGQIMSSIDGGPWITSDLYTAWSGSLHLPWYFTLYSTLAAGNHTLQLKMSATKSGWSNGTVARIRYFYVSGNETISAILPVEKDDLINIICNSATRELTIKANSDLPFSFKVFDFKGVTIARKLMCRNNDNIRLLNRGIYFVEIIINNQRIVKKIML